MQQRWENDLLRIWMNLHLLSADTGSLDCVSSGQNVEDKRDNHYMKRERES